MKNTIKTLTLASMIAASLTSVAQTEWSLTGNNISNTTPPPSPLKLGTIDATDLPFYTNDVQRMTLTAEGRLGLGIQNPNGNFELKYCLTPSNNKGGLFITKNFCGTFPPSTYNPNSNPEVIGGPFVPDSPPETNRIIYPFSYLTGHTTKLAQPYPNLQDEAPLLWARTLGNNGWQFSQPDNYDTKFIVLPDGSCGINIVQPRAALDVRGSQGINRPAAIFGSLAQGTYIDNSSTGLPMYNTQQVQFVPILGDNGFNRITQAGDQGMFFSDGLGTDGSNAGSAFILAPWAQEADEATVGGMRMDKFGNTEFHGTLRATKVNVDAKWWSDFVFDADYELKSLAEVEAYIAANKHLPDVPSEEEVLANGLDLGEMQAIQQQKIEELTLYIIQQQKQMDALLVMITELKK
jgi:hypothetical protein